LLGSLTDYSRKVERKEKKERSMSIIERGEFPFKRMDA
jgi:hypothetical protein